MNYQVSTKTEPSLEHKFTPTTLDCSECGENNFKNKIDLVFHLIFNHLRKQKMNSTVKDKNQNTMSYPTVRKTLNLPKSTSTTESSSTKSKSHRSSAKTKQIHPCYMCKLEFQSWTEWKQHAIISHIIPKNPYPKVEMNYVNFQSIMHSKKSVPTSISPPQRSNSTDSESGNEQLKLTVCRDNGNYVVKRTMSSPPIAPAPMESSTPKPSHSPAPTRIASTPLQTSALNINNPVATTNSLDQNDNENPDKENITSGETEVLETGETIPTPTTSDLLQKKSSTSSSGAVVFLGTSSTDTDRALAKSASAQTSRMVVIQNDVLQSGDGVGVAVAEKGNLQSNNASIDDVESEKSNPEKVNIPESISRSPQPPSILRAMISQGQESNNNLNASRIAINTILGINDGDDEKVEAKSGNRESDESNTKRLNSKPVQQQRPASVIISVPRKESDYTKNNKSQASSRSSTPEDSLMVSEEVLSDSSEPTLTIDTSGENDDDSNSGNTLTLEESEQIIVEQQNGERRELDLAVDPLAITDDADDFRCRVCGELFTSDDALDDHFSQNHFRGIGTDILEPPSPFTPVSIQPHEVIQERQQQAPSVMEIRRLAQPQSSRPTQDSMFRPYTQNQPLEAPVQTPQRQAIPTGFPFRPTGGHPPIHSPATTQVSNSGSFVGNGIRNLQPSQNVLMSQAQPTTLRNVLSYSLNQTSSGDGPRQATNLQPVRRLSHEFDVPRIDGVTSLSQMHPTQNTRPLSPAVQQQLQQQLNQRQEQLNRINAQQQVQANLHNQLRNQHQQQQMQQQQRNFISELQMREAQVRAMNAMRMEDRIRQEQASLQQRNSQIRLAHQMPPPPMRPIVTQLPPAPGNYTNSQGKRPMSQEEINYRAKLRRLEGQQQVLNSGVEFQQQLRPRPALVPNPNLIRQQQQQKTAPSSNLPPEKPTTLRIPNSITLSVCPSEPAEELSPNSASRLRNDGSVQRNDSSPTFNTDSVASELAGRGVTITSAHTNNENQSRVDPTPAHRLPAMISIANVSARTSPLAQQISPVPRNTPPNHQFAVPMNPAPRAGTVASSMVNTVADRPERPPTVDLTQDEDAYIANNSTRRPIPTLRQGIIPTRPPTSYSCNLCNVLFNNLAALEDHKLRQHGARNAGFNPGQRINLPVTRPPNAPGTAQIRPSNPNGPNSNTRHLYIPLLDMNRIDVMKMKRLEELGIFSIIPLQGNERSLGATMGIPILNINSSGNNLPFDCSLPIGPVTSSSNLAIRNGNNNIQTQR